MKKIVYKEYQEHKNKKYCVKKRVFTYSPRKYKDLVKKNRDRADLTSIRIIEYEPYEVEMLQRCET